MYCISVLVQDNESKIINRDISMNGVCVCVCTRHEFIHWTMATMMQAELRRSQFLTVPRRHNNEIQAVYSDETRTPYAS